MGLVQLPSELIFLIAEWLDTQDSILSLALVNRRLSELVTHHLLKFNIRHRQSSALLWAAKRGCKKTTRKLLKLKADVNTSTRSALMPLHFAAQAGHITIARWLIKHGASIESHGAGSIPIFLALISGHEELANMLFDKMTSHDAAISNSMPGQTALHVACRYNQQRSVKHFIEAGATVDVKDELGMAPLDYAMGLSIFLLLVDQEADPALDSWVVRELRGEHPDKRVQRIYLRNGGPAWSLRGFDYASISIGRAWVGKPYLDASSGSKEQDARESGGHASERHNFSSLKAFPQLHDCPTKYPELGPWTPNEVNQLVAQLSAQGLSVRSSQRHDGEAFPQLFQGVPDQKAIELWSKLKLFQKANDHALKEGDMNSDGGLTAEPVSMVRVPQTQPEKFPPLGELKSQDTVAISAWTAFRTGHFTQDKPQKALLAAGRVRKKKWQPLKL